jgi:hypothetical protein
VLHSTADLADYLAGQPDGAQVLLQSLIDLSGKAGVFCIRHPGDRRGRIVSLALVYPPHVTSDGVSTVAAVVGRDPILRANATVYRQRSPEAWERVLAAGKFHCLTNAAIPIPPIALFLTVNRTTRSAHATLFAAIGAAGAGVMDQLRMLLAAPTLRGELVNYGDTLRFLFEFLSSGLQDSLR